MAKKQSKKIKKTELKKDVVDKLSGFSKIISFIFPIIGIIIYFDNKNNFPNKAKSAKDSLVWGIIFNVLFFVFSSLIKNFFDIK